MTEKKSTLTEEEEKKIDEIKTFISKSEKIDKFTKNVCIALINASNLFTKPVYFALDLSPVIDNRFLGTSNIEKGLEEIMKSITDFRFYYEERTSKCVSIFLLGTNSVWLLIQKELDKNL